MHFLVHLSDGNTALCITGLSDPVVARVSGLDVRGLERLTGFPLTYSMLTAFYRPHEDVMPPKRSKGLKGCLEILSLPSNTQPQFPALWT